MQNILPHWHDGVLLNDGNSCEDKATRNIYFLDCVECNHKNYSAIRGNKLGSFYFLVVRDEHISDKGFKIWWDGRASHHPKCSYGVLEQVLEWDGTNIHCSKCRDAQHVIPWKNF